MLTTRTIKPKKSSIRFSSRSLDRIDASLGDVMESPQGSNIAVSPANTLPQRPATAIRRNGQVALTVLRPSTTSGGGRRHYQQQHDAPEMSVTGTATATQSRGSHRRLDAGPLTSPTGGRDNGSVRAQTAPAGARRPAPGYGTQRLPGANGKALSPTPQRDAAGRRSLPVSDKGSPRLQGNNALGGGSSRGSKSQQGPQQSAAHEGDLAAGTDGDGPGHEEGAPASLPLQVQIISIFKRFCISVSYYELY